MRTRGSGGSVSLALAFLVFLPGLAFSQTISGLVSDTTGAVLPGVTVEAASPALIEKVKSVVSDAQGRYTIVDLRPGTYRVTFTLAGFNTLVREGLELSSNTTLPVNGELKVGALEETVTVSGQSPLVDVQSTQRTQVISRDTIDSLPVSRNYKSVGALMIGVRTGGQQIGDLAAGTQSKPTVHGAPSETTMLFDGLMALTLMVDGQINQYHNDGIAQEVSFQTSAVNAEVSRGGLVINIIPKDGGNTWKGGGFFSHQTGDWQADNTTDALRAKGIATPNKLIKAHDWNPYIGGPIKKDRLWIIYSGRSTPVWNTQADSYYADGRPCGNSYILCDSDGGKARPGIVNNDTYQHTARLNMQLTQKNKVVVFYDRIFKHVPTQLAAGEAPDTGTHDREPRNYSVEQLKWTSTISSKLLFEAGWSGVVQTYFANITPFDGPLANVWQRRGTPEWYAQAPHFDLTSGKRWHEGECSSTRPGACRDIPVRYTSSATVSYVTGTHNIKSGVQFGSGYYRRWHDNPADLVQVYQTGVPQFVDVSNTPNDTFEKLNADLGVFVQDTWVIKRLTLNPGVRFEHFNASIEKQTQAAGRFLPERTFGPVKDLPNWNDIAPRFGGAYDVFGNGKTAIKAGIGRYEGNSGLDITQRYNPFAIATDRRNWNDCAYLPGTSTCDPALIGAAGYHDDIAQDNEIGPSNNNNFGVRVSRQMDPSLKRPFNIEYSASVQHQLFNGFSVYGGWYRRTYYNIEKQDNLLVEPTDYTQFFTANPLGNGELVPIYNLNPAKRGQVLIQDTTSKTNRRTYDGIEFSFNWRLPNGGTIFAGGGPEKVVSRICDTDNPNLFRFCDQFGKLYQDLGTQPKVPWAWDIKFVATTPLPKGFDFGIVAQSNYGNANRGGFERWLNVNWAAPASVFPNGQRTESYNVKLVAPGAKLLDQVRQIDISVKRKFQFGRVRMEPRLDVYNLLNSSVVLATNQSFGTSLDRPTEVLGGRLPRIAIQVDF